MADIPPRVLALLKKTDPDQVRFIKLGKKSCWWPIARETATLRLGFREIDSALCAKGNWAAAKSKFEKQSTKKKGVITQFINQVRDFYELPETTLWCTIEDGDVWWCFSKQEVSNLPAGNDAAEERLGSRTRPVIDKWRNTDIHGERLRLDSMTTKFTKVASFQSTIAKPSGATDLIRRIRAEHSTQHFEATKAHKLATSTLGDLLDQLHQTDFELLIELIFSSSGWKRISAVGGTQKTLDLAMMLPTTGEYCFVQVKSQTTPAILKKLVTALENSQGYSRMFFTIIPLPMRLT